MPQQIKILIMTSTYLASKPRYEILDGLRGVAALIVVAFHLFETYSKGPVFQIILKSATKPLNFLIAFTRPLITEFADNLNLKHPLLPTISPYPTM